VADVQGQDGEGGEAEVTDPAFGRLLYTDCPPGNGRGSGGGFQIQAQSPAVDPQLASFAVGWLLYEAQSAWVSDRRPVDDFPIGFAHAGAEGYGTAQGRYLGKEAVGGRMGNHLADCLLTRDPELYGTIRPAQLWQSPMWRARAWETRDCPDFDGDLELGPLDLDSVTGWARERAERAPALARLLSVLEDPKGQRVVIVSADAEEAMRWIAAATLLLPQRQALGVSFKVFSNNPLRAQHRVVAAPPDVYPDLRPGAGLGVFVLDVATCLADEATTTERSRFLIGKLTGDEDPEDVMYDVMDASDLAYELSGRTWPLDITALYAAWALTRPGDPVTDPDALFRWLQEAGKGPLREHGPAITQTLLAGAPSADVLRWLDVRVAARELEFDHEVIRLRLLDAEIAGALAGQAATEGTLPDARLGDQARRDAESALTSALLRGADDNKVDFPEADRLLRLARRHGTSLEPLSPPIETLVKNFAWAWVNSSKPQDPKDWALRERIVAEARAELRALYADDPSAEVVRNKVRRFIPYFSGLIGAEDPLYWPMQAAAITSLSDERQVPHLRKLLAWIDDLRKTDRPGASRALKGLQDALLDWDAASEPIAVTILTSASGGSQVIPEIADRARNWLAVRARQPDRAFLADLEKLGDRVPASPPELAEIADGNRKVTQFLAAVESGKVSQDRTRSLAVKSICRAHPTVMKLRAAEVISALRTDPDLAIEVLETLPDNGKKVAATLVTEIGKRFGRLTEFDDQVEWALWAFLIYADRRVPEASAGLLHGAIRKFPGAVNASGGKGADKWRAEVRGRLGRDDLRESWDSLFPKHGITFTFRS
jgi:hypothetical protein